MKSFVIAFVVTFVFAVLLPMQGIGKASDVNEKEETMDMELLDAVKAIGNDVPNDLKSLVWNGESFAEVEDELDNSDILDGRSGEYAYNRFKAEMMTVYCVDREKLLTADHVVQNDGLCFSAQAENRFVRISRSEQTYELLQTAHLERIQAGEIIEESFEWLNGLCEKTILTAPDGRKMAGVRFIVPAEDGSAVCFEYGGIGNYSDILTEAEMMVQKTNRA